MKFNKIIRISFPVIFQFILSFSSYGQTVTLTLQKTIESPRVFIPGADDKGGYWKDFGSTRAFDFYPETNMLAALIQETNGPVRLYNFNLATGQKLYEKIVAAYNQNSSGFGTLKFSPDGKWIAISTGFDKEITVWDALNGNLIGRKLTDDKSSNLDWSPDGEKLAVVAGHKVEIWSLTPFERVKFIQGGRTATEWVSVANWSPDGIYLAIGTNNPSIYIDKDGRQSAALAPVTKGNIYMAGWNADGTMLTSEGYGLNSNIAIWQSVQNAVDFPFEKKYNLIRTIDPAPGNGWNKFDWDPSGRIIVAGDNKSNIFFWNASSGQLLNSAKPNPTSNITEVHWKKNYLITVGSYPDKSFKVWQTEVH